jgi:protein-S-isoprenylcysteine O-methyltransferase Ste14
MRIPVPAIVVPLVVLLLYFLVPGVKERPWTAVRIAGAILAVAGYILLLTARAQLGKSFAVTPQAKALVTHGLYSRIRNPIYVFVNVMWFGVIVALHVYWLFAPLLAHGEKVRCCDRPSDRPTSIIENRPGVDAGNSGPTWKHGALAPR